MRPSHGALFEIATVSQGPAPTTANPPDQASPDPTTAPLTWATRLKRVFNIDITLRPQYGERLRVMAEIMQPDVIHMILEHLKQRYPTTDTGRAPPAKAAGRSASAGNPESITA